MASSVLKGTRLAGKVCIITGAGSLHGIGRATAHRFAREGARHLYLVDLVADNFPTIQSSLHETNPDVKVTTIQADAADEEKIASICKMATNENGRLDVFFANAGKVVANSDSLEPYQTISAEQFMKCISNNTLSCFLALKHAADAMAKADESAGKLTGGGSIILTSSSMWK
ncbi:hypothetical protein PHLCEN_2v9202 [Hermanssonia centrifuga]|uniref:Uncharacterized protein n=1 Tax=Hermanssonia centrifuga TaxID=98765 RepID=A0A2R6NRH1_9APHY|nr:hypothetical protein PHLCEN_2v9202 [Hermanssonia centrifuga]